MTLREVLAMLWPWKGDRTPTCATDEREIERVRQRQEAVRRRLEALEYEVEIVALTEARRQ